jgi:hypothetical protein
VSGRDRIENRVQRAAGELLMRLDRLALGHRGDEIDNDTQEERHGPSAARNLA